MIKKHIICPELLRRIPKHFSWLDHRLVRDGYFHRCKTEELALYLFLATVSDAQGLSFYSDNSLCKQLNISLPVLRQVRQALTNIGLIAYEEPLYQVLSLDRNSLNSKAITSPRKKDKNRGHPSQTRQESVPYQRQPRAEKLLHIGEIINRMPRRFET